MDDMIPIRENLLKRYELGSAAEGTRSGHDFVHESTSEIRAKMLSMEEKLTTFHAFHVSQEEAHAKLIYSLKTNDYITCIYGEYWSLALVNDVNREEKDVHCKFMHPHGYTENLYWPTRDNETYVPFNKILLKVNTLNTLSRSRREYKI